jgi:hypothetical protein
MWNLPDRVRKGIPAPPDLDALATKLDEIEQAADRASDRVNQLDLRLQAQAASDYRRSVVQTLIGTLIGLVGGYSASWVDQGGALFPSGALGRAGIFTAGALLLVLVAPVCIFPRVDRFLVWLNRFRLGQ